MSDMKDSKQKAFDIVCLLMDLSLPKDQVDIIFNALDPKVQEEVRLFIETVEKVLDR